MRWQPGTKPPHETIHETIYVVVRVFTRATVRHLRHFGDGHMFLISTLTIQVGLDSNVSLFSFGWGQRWSKRIL